MEPEWTKRISNESICNFFYAFFIAYAIIAALGVLGLITSFMTLKLPKGLMIAQGFYGLLMIALATTMALFHYLVCDRALQPGSRGLAGRGDIRPAQESNPDIVAY